MSRKDKSTFRPDAGRPPLPANDLIQIMAVDDEFIMQQYDAVKLCCCHANMLSLRVSENCIDRKFGS
jgi:hypothetical protein